MNLISEVKECPHCKNKLRFALYWKAKCDIDWKKKEHKANLEIENIDLFVKE